MINKTENMITILDRLMNGSIEVFFDIIGDNYDNFLTFYDAFKCMDNIVFNNILYNLDSTTDGFEVVLELENESDVSRVTSILENQNTSNTNVVYEVGGTRIVVNITIGGE